MKNRNCLCCFCKYDKPNLATANYFISKSVMYVAIYPKYKLLLSHATQLSLPLESQVHWIKVSIILTKWLCWLKLVKVIKYETLILSTNHCIFSNNLLWGITVLFIICLFIYFEYFLSISLIYIIFEESNVKKDKLQSRQPSQLIQNPELVEFQWSAYNACLLSFYTYLLRSVITLASRVLCLKEKEKITATITNWWRR